MLAGNGRSARAKANGRYADLFCLVGAVNMRSIGNWTSVLCLSLSITSVLAQAEELPAPRIRELVLCPVRG
jgi:hypothetical protein